MGRDIIISATVNKKKTKYKQVERVVFGTELLTKKDFFDLLKELRADTGRLIELQHLFDNANKLVTITPEGNYTEVLDDYENIAKKFIELFAGMRNGTLGKLGGKIGLITSFYTGDNNNQETYWLDDINNLNKYIDEFGVKHYSNALNIVKNIAKIKKLNSVFVNHFIQFNTEIHDRFTPKKDVGIVKGWAENNFKDTLYLDRKGKKRRLYSLAQYIWKGNMRNIGYPMESYVNHVFMFHGASAPTNNVSVVQEHGGQSSESLLELLYLSKGNLKSQLGGDALIAIKNNNIEEIIYNLQIKASTRNSYYVKTTYSQFIRDIVKFRDVISSNKFTKEDADELFELFKADILLRIQGKMDESANKIAEKIVDGI